MSGEAHYSLVHGRCKQILPSDDFIYYCLLLAGGAAEIDTGGLDALVAHKVSEQWDVVELFKEVLGVAVPEWVRINHFGV